MMNSSQPTPISEELLSAYLDDAVTPQERALVETAMAEDAEVAWRLETLRLTVTLLNKLPELQTPRSFALTPAMVYKSAASGTRASNDQENERTSVWTTIQSFFQAGSPLMRNFATASFASFLILAALGSFTPGSSTDIIANGRPAASAEIAAAPQPVEQVVAKQSSAQEPADAGTVSDEAETAQGTATFVALRSMQEGVETAETPLGDAPVFTTESLETDAAAYAAGPAATNDEEVLAAAVPAAEDEAERAQPESSAAEPAAAKPVVIAAGQADSAAAAELTAADESMAEESTAGVADTTAPQMGEESSVAETGASVAAAKEVSTMPGQEDSAFGTDQSPLRYVQIVALTLAVLFAALWLMSRSRTAAS